MISLFRKKPKQIPSHNLTDVHSHFLPELDDGAKDMPETLLLLEEMKALGYKKLITTPHILHEFYPNTPNLIRKKLQGVRQKIEERDLGITLEAAAEYHLDEFFMASLEEEEPLMTFGDNYLLFETPFMNEPVYLKEAVFKLLTLGYKPVLAHPERYLYLQRNFGLAEEMAERGVLFQLNINSLSGHYSKSAKAIAEKMIDQEMVHLLGSDCHAQRHIELLQQTMRSKYFQKALELPLLNHQL